MAALIDEQIYLELHKVLHHYAVYCHNDINWKEFTKQHNLMVNDVMAEMKSIYRTAFEGLFWYIYSTFNQSTTDRAYMRAAVIKFRDTVRGEFKEMSVHKLASFENKFRSQFDVQGQAIFSTLLVRAQAIFDQTSEKSLNANLVAELFSSNAKQMVPTTYAVLAGWLLNIAGPNIQKCISQVQSTPVENSEGSNEQPINNADLNSTLSSAQGSDANKQNADKLAKILPDI